MGLVFVTGASGFIGRSLITNLISQRFWVRAAIRSGLPRDVLVDSHLEYVTSDDISFTSDWSYVMTSVDCVIHAAARTHLMGETEGDALLAYRAVNVAGTRRLAEQAAAAGVRRFVFLSSVKVTGETTEGPVYPLYACDNARAYMAGQKSGGSVADPYAVSKWEAEQALREISAKTGLEVVVVRPPLVYGPGVKGNLARLLKLVRSGVPLPLHTVENKRSFIGLDNLVDLLTRCVDHPGAAGKTLLVSDGQDLSTPELLRMIANAMGQNARLFPVPVPLLRVVGRALGRLNEVDRLVGSLQVDSSATREVLGWSPPVSVEEGIRRMVMSVHQS